MFNNVFANIRNKSLNRQISKDLIYKNATYSRKHVTIYHPIPLFTLPGFRFNPNRSEGLLGFVLTPTFPTISASPSGSRRIGAVKQRYTVSVAMLHYRCKGVALLVQLCCHYQCQAATLSVYLCWTDGIPMQTDGIPMLDYRYTYAGLSVHLCWTFGTRMLYFSGTVFRKSLQWPK